MNFKKYYITEGRDKWNLFNIKKCNERWSFYNTESKKRFFIKLGNDDNSITGMQRFLEAISASTEQLPKTKGYVDFYEFAQTIIEKRNTNVYIKNGMFEKIKKTWLLDEINK